MPCYEVRTMSVEFHAQHKSLLITALKNLGWNWREEKGKLFTSYDIEVDLEKQQANVPEGCQDQLNRLKRAYSSEAISKVAKVNLWQRKADNDQKGILRKF